MGENEMAEELDRETVQPIFEEVAASARILGELFLANLRDDEVASLLQEVTALPSLEDWPFGGADELARAHRLITDASSDDRAALGREYQRLFIGPHHFNAPPWGSVYLDADSVILGASNVALCKWMAAHGIEMHDAKKEPEDHIGKMFALLSWLAEEKPELVGEYLSDHLMPWAFRYLELLEGDARHPFYRGLAVLARETLDDASRRLKVTAAPATLYF